MIFCQHKFTLIKSFHRRSISGNRYITDILVLGLPCSSVGAAGYMRDADADAVSRIKIMDMFIIMFASGP